MSIPHEGSRATHEGLVISSCPDVCLTPRGPVMVPVPYSIVAKQNDDTATTRTVHMTSLRTHNTGSLITRCSGDAPGTGKGVKSGTVESICEPKSYSPTVRTEGKPVIRHDDQWWMNNRNTIGNLNYIKDTRPRVQLASTLTLPGSLTMPRFGPLPLPRIIDPLLPAPMPFGLTDEQMEQKLPEHLRPIVPEEDNTQPTPEEQPGEDPKPVPVPIPDTRVTGKCRAQTICFDAKEYDRKELDRQLQMQQDMLNGKTPEQYLQDVGKFDAAPPGYMRELAKPYQSTARDNYITANRDSFVAQHGPDAWDQHMKSLAAIHRLDMVAGGTPSDIAGMGNLNVNSSIGAQWPAQSRRGQLDNYAREMHANGCPMNVSLQRCWNLVA